MNFVYDSILNNVDMVTRLLRKLLPEILNHGLNIGS
jgi:hypothetical protein